MTLVFCSDTIFCLSAYIAMTTFQAVTEYQHGIGSTFDWFILNFNNLLDTRRLGPKKKYK